MRLPAATLLALSACNQFYGLDPTKVRDAAPDAHDRQILLSMLVGGTTDMGTQSAAVIADVTPDPKPAVALVDKDLVPVGYGAGGIVGYPIEFVGKQWRLEYTPQGSTPIEVQWSPADFAGHVIVPVVGRVERTQVPTNTGYLVSMKKPDTTKYLFADPVIYTTGYWSATPALASLDLPVDFSVAPSMSGPAGAPSATAKDVVVALDYQIDAGTNCRYARIGGTAVATELEQGALKSLDLQIELGNESVVLTYKGQPTMDARFRLGGVLGARAGDESGSHATFGRLAHTGLPAFTTTIADVPAPHIIPLATCPILVQQPPPVSVVGGLSFTRGMYSVLANDRMVSGVRLRSSIAAVGVLVSGTSTYEATFDVPLATTVTLGIDDLIGRSDSGFIAPMPNDLTIGIEQNSAFVVDYYEVALYRLTANSLELVRTYVGTNPNAATIRFDPSVMAPNAEHVFAIRTYRGRPNARVADFSTVQGAQTVGTIFTRTFRR